MPTLGHRPGAIPVYSLALALGPLEPGTGGGLNVSEVRGV
jgi:hypothetical protein